MAKVLIVDDDSRGAALLAKLLGTEGHEVECASSAGSALGLLHHQVPDLVLLDLNMPRFGGLEALRVLKNDARYKHLRVCIYTGLSDTQAVEAALHLGACDVVLKGDDWHRTFRRILDLLPPAQRALTPQSVSA